MLENILQAQTFSSVFILLLIICKINVKIYNIFITTHDKFMVNYNTYIYFFYE